MAEDIIREGSIVRYNGTGTVGVVKVLKTEDDGRWALLDSTGLYYHLSSLEPIEHMPDKKELGGRTLEEFVDDLKTTEEELSSIRMEDESVESGG